MHTPPPRKLERGWQRDVIIELTTVGRSLGTWLNWPPEKLAYPLSIMSPLFLGSRSARKNLPSALYGRAWECVTRGKILCTEEQELRNNQDSHDLLGCSSKLLRSTEQAFQRRLAQETRFLFCPQTPEPRGQGGCGVEAETITDHSHCTISLWPSAPSG